MSKPPPPQSLGALLARAEDFALFSMRSGGKVPPALLADTPGGPLFFLPSTLRDERAKDSATWRKRKGSGASPPFAPQRVGKWRDSVNCATMA